MSEQTGASPEQIEAAVARRYNETSATARLLPWETVHRDMQRSMKDLFVRDCAQYLVPPGSKIVPADAVVVTPEIAATAAEALPRVIAFLCGYGHSRPQLAADIIAITDLATSFEAAAAALRGEG